MTYHDLNVPAASVQRSFGMWREQAAKGPVYITHHGRPSHVLMSHEHYVTITQPADSPGSTDHLAASLSAIVDDIDQGMMIMDGRGHVVKVNRIFCEHVGLSAGQIVDRSLREIFPQVAESIFARHIEAALRYAKRTMFRARSLLRDDCWLQVDMFPIPAGAAMLFRNISEEVAQERIAIVRQAMEKALDLNERIGVAVLSPRGALQRINPAFAALTGASPQVLADASIFDLIAIRRRFDFRHEFERAFRGEDHVQLRTALLARDGGETPVDMAFVPIRGDLAIEGAIGIAVAA